MKKDKGTLPRDLYLGVPLTFAEKTALTAAAKRERMRLAPYVRKLAILSLPLEESHSLPIVHNEMARFLGHLGHIASLLNDKNSGGLHPTDELYQSIFYELRTLRNEVLKSLGVKP